MHLPFSSYWFNNLLSLLEHICHIYNSYLSAYLSKNSTIFGTSFSVSIDWLFSLLMLEFSCLFGRFILDYRHCECMHKSPMQLEFCVYLTRWEGLFYSFFLPAWISNCHCIIYGDDIHFPHGSTTLCCNLNIHMCVFFFPDLFFLFLWFAFLFFSKYHVILIT